MMVLAGMAFALSVGEAPLFHAHRLGLLIVLVVFAIAVLAYIRRARRGKRWHVRRIEGLEAVEEAVGRATELGKPVLFSTGVRDMSDMQTVAGLINLGHVAASAAEHGTPLIVPTNRALVMTAAREAVRSACVRADRPGAYREDSVYYIADDHFAYAASVAGTLSREKPAACFFLGAFHAESLILAESANMAGSMQVAGTANVTQLPFFIAASDYTLIGEELFAASAYLSNRPEQLGTLKAQDVGKIVAVGVILLGSILATAVALTGGPESPLRPVLDGLDGLLRSAFAW